MRRTINHRIFARTDTSDLVGRSVELERLRKHAAGEGGLVVLAVPSAGVSELLRQTYDHLFYDQSEIIPFYFEIKPSDLTVQNTARRFVSEFLTQTVAFGRHDARIIDVSPGIDEIAELAAPTDVRLVDSLTETLNGADVIRDERAFLRNCLSAPLRAEINNARAFVMIDALHAAAELEGGEAFIEDIIDIFSRTSIPFVFSGSRRFLFARTPFETMSVDPLGFEDAGRLAEKLAVKTRVSINDQTRDLIAVQFGGIPHLITSLFSSAATNGRDLKNFDRVEQAYTDEVFGGRIAKHFDTILNRIFPNAELQTRVLNVLNQNLTASDGRVAMSYWKKHLGLESTIFDAMLEALRCSEIIDVSSGIIQIDLSNHVLCDYLRGRIRLEIDGANRALVVGEAVSANVKRASELMARFYRRNSAVGLRELLQMFDGRKISPALIDYGQFKNEFKGSDDEKIVKALKEDNFKIALPQIVYTAHTGNFYAKLNELCDIERSAVALGFSDVGKKEETAWITAEIESKLEANRDVAEVWCERLAMAAKHCNFERFKLWLIAPEGFSAEAMELLRSRNAYGSSRKQVALLAAMIGGETAAHAEKVANEYEFVLPMGENTEMIAAHTLEEIAKRHSFPPKAINQIKTALVEACINASEHSLSPDRKIYQKFAVDDDKITITVSNRGIRLADKVSKETVPDEGRRGWGIKLIQGLMDEVHTEHVDDGTRITMVKYLGETVSSTQ